MTNQPPQIDLNLRLCRSENILFTQIDDDRVMVDPENGSYFGLNEVAGEIWDLLSQPITPAEICTELQARFEVDSQTCQNETQAVLGRMLRLKLIRISDAGAA